MRADVAELRQLFNKKDTEWSNFKVRGQAVLPAFSLKDMNKQLTVSDAGEVRLNGVQRRVLWGGRQQSAVLNATITEVEERVGGQPLPMDEMVCPSTETLPRTARCSTHRISAKHSFPNSKPTIVRICPTEAETCPV